jgi:hypothetical protein
MGGLLRSIVLGKGSMFPKGIFGFMFTIISLRAVGSLLKRSRSRLRRLIGRKNEWWCVMGKVEIKEDWNFAITGHKGFQLKFGNGWIVSVQWGPGNYCDNRDTNYDKPEELDYWESKSAEIAVWHSENSRKFIWLGSDSVRGWLTSDDVAKVLALVASFKSKDNIKASVRVLKEVFNEESNGKGFDEEDE